jgi:hypothetical protein
MQINRNYNYPNQEPTSRNILPKKMPRDILKAIREFFQQF